MIFRQLKFDVMTNEAGAWKREPVKEIGFIAGFGASYVKTESGKEIALDPMQTALLQSTGFFDKDGNEIYHGHILKDAESKFYSVIFFNGGFCALQGENDPVALSHEFSQTVEVCGDEFNDGALLMPDSPEAVFEQSEKRNEK